MKNYLYLTILSVFIQKTLCSVLNMEKFQYTQDNQINTDYKLTTNGKWIPEHYSTDSDDQLMRNLIEAGLAYTKDKGFDDKYPFLAKKGCGCMTEDMCKCCMAKHVHYWVDKKGAYDAAKELVGTNLHMKGQKLNDYLAENFDELWKKYDVIETGWVEVERMSMFYKELMKDWTMTLQ